MHRYDRYESIAPAYDLLSFEWPVYRVGRVVGVRELELRPGDRVLDVGCGTGLSFSLLQAAVGPSGRVVGIDASRHMLGRAGRRIRRHGWSNIELVCANAATMDRGSLRHLLGTPAHQMGAPAGPGSIGADAILFTYSLSVMHPWQQAWDSALAIARPGARIAVVDMGLPVGAAQFWAALARLACAAGGADIHAEPWLAAQRDLTDLTSRSLRAGHIQVRAGNLPSPNPSNTNGTRSLL